MAGAIEDRVGGRRRGEQLHHWRCRFEQLQWRCSATANSTAPAAGDEHRERRRGEQPPSGSTMRAKEGEDGYWAARGPIQVMDPDFVAAGDI